MTPLEFIAAAHVAATIIVGFGQIAIVAIGIRAMNRSSDEHARDRKAREQAEDQRHVEAMAKLGEQSHALEVLIRQSDASTAALRELITRTAPAAD